MPHENPPPGLRCLVVDDDTEIREDVGAYLRGFGMQVELAADGQAMRRAVAAGRFDAIVLDVMLPDENGLTLCQWAREHGGGCAILMLTAQGDPMSRVVGLELGADDYIGKPFEPRELVARIHAAVRRTRRGPADPPADDPTTSLRFAGWTFDRLRRQLLSPDGVALPLSAAEHRLLSAFVERPGRVLTREQLIEMTRAPGVDVSDRSIDLAVSRLRHRLGDSPREPRLIRTLRGEGYLFDTVVERG